MSAATTLAIITSTAEAYGTVLTEERMRVYVDLLADLPPVALKAAAEAHVATCKWFPTVAELRAFATQAQVGTVPTADEAWGEVVSEISRVGSYDTPVFSHPAITNTVNAMGWRTLCMSEEQMADRAHFLRLYGTCRDRIQRDAAIPEVVRAALTPLAEHLAGEPMALAAGTDSGSET